MTKVLLTGFGDWAESHNNPATAVVGALQGQTIAGATIDGIIAPTVLNQMIPPVARHRAVSTMETRVSAKELPSYKAYL